MPVINPYQNVDFQNDQKVLSCSHEHVYFLDDKDQEGGDNMIDHLYSKGFRHLAFSEYWRPFPYGEDDYPKDFYGSAPMYPLGRWYNGDLPGDLIASPNSESFGAHFEPGHIITLGSLASTIGNHGERFGLSEFQGVRLWDVSNNERITLINQQIWDYILNGIEDPNGPGTIGGLLHADGGGMYQAHFDVSMEQLYKNLDRDPRWLGMAMYNDRRDKEDVSIARADRGYATKEWDTALATGRRCWGFSESDRGRRGANTLLLSEFTEHEALKAYREGRFYCRTKWEENPTLYFTKIDAGEDKIEVETVGAGNGVRIISEKGVVATSETNSIEYTYPKDLTNEVDLTFLRVEAFGDLFDPESEADVREYPLPNYDTGERYDDEIFSQPIMFRTKKEVDSIVRKRRNRKYFAAGII